MTKQVNFVPINAGNAEAVVEGYKNRFHGVVVEQLEEFYKITYDDSKKPLYTRKMNS